VTLPLPTHAVELVGLTKRFVGRALEGNGRRAVRQEIVAVDGVDLEIPRGEIFGLLGPNGAGKTTTIRMLCTLLVPSGGTARVWGFDVATQATELGRDGRVHVRVLDDAGRAEIGGQAVTVIEGEIRM